MFYNRLTGSQKTFLWTFCPEPAFYGKTGREHDKKPFRRHLSMPGMLKTMRQHFGGIPDPIRTRGTGLSDCLMSGLAVFFFKTPSLPRFDRNTRGGGDPVMARNLHALFGVARAKQQSPSGCTGASTRSTRGPCAGASRRCTRLCGAALENRTALGGHFRWRWTAPDTIPQRRSNVKAVASGTTRGGTCICGTNREVWSAGSPSRTGRRSLRLSRARSNSPLSATASSRPCAARKSSIPIQPQPRQTLKSRTGRTPPGNRPCAAKTHKPAQKAKSTAKRA